MLVIVRDEPAAMLPIGHGYDAQPESVDTSVRPGGVESCTIVEVASDGPAFETVVV